MAAPLVALGVANPEINALSAFAQGNQAAQVAESNQLANAKAGMENIASIALGTMGGKLDGQVDPQLWDEALGMYEGFGVDTKGLKGRPDLAPIVARAGLSALQQLQLAQNDREYELALKKFDADIEQAVASINRPTDDQREYAQAVEQGFTGTFMDYQSAMKKAGAMNVNLGPNGVDYGDPGAGLVWQRGQDGTVVLDDRGAPIAIPFQGGKAWNEQQDAADKKALVTAGKDAKTDIVSEDIDRALGILKKDPTWTSGLFGGWLAQIDGTKARDLRGLIDTVKANAGFQELQKMREASPTGGALGNVTERELAFLQSTIGNLEQGQTAEQLAFNLERVKEAFLDIIHGPGNRPGAATETPSGPEPSIDDLLKKYLN